VFIPQSSDKSKGSRMNQVAQTLALQIAAQLPEDFSEAGQVLECLDELRHWRAGRPFSKSLSNFAVIENDQTVLLLRRGEAGKSSGSSPSCLASRMDRPSVLPK
jgi:hypothetical protein